MSPNTSNTQTITCPTCGNSVCNKYLSLDEIKQTLLDIQSSGEVEPIAEQLIFDIKNTYNVIGISHIGEKLMFDVEKK